MIRGLENITCEEAEKAEAMESSERDGSGGNMITVYKYLQGNNRNEGRELFTVSENCRPRSNGLKLRKKKFR